MRETVALVWKALFTTSFDWSTTVPMYNIQYLIHSLLNVSIRIEWQILYFQIFIFQVDFTLNNINLKFKFWKFFESIRLKLRTRASFLLTFANDLYYIFEDPKKPKLSITFTRNLPFRIYWRETCCANGTRPHSTVETRSVAVKVDI